MPDVTIPADVAKQHAEWLRTALVDSRAAALADLLDPRPASLREQVANVIGRPEAFGTDVAHADAVLAVVADWLAAQPLVPHSCMATDDQRDADVALIRGGAE